MEQNERSIMSALIDLAEELKLDLPRINLLYHIHGQVTLDQATIDKMFLSIFDNLKSGIQVIDPTRTESLLSNIRAMVSELLSYLEPVNLMGNSSHIPTRYLKSYTELQKLVTDERVMAMTDLLVNYDRTDFGPITELRELMNGKEVTTNYSHKFNSLMYERT